MIPSHVVLLSDANTNGYCVPLLKLLVPTLTYADAIVIPQGELHKNENTLFFIIQQLADLRCTRSTMLVCVGGGVLCDIGAFAASIFKRGIPVALIPTTLLSMVDAAIGGKTGVDVGMIKNMIGTFYEPMWVYTNPLFLNTLPQAKKKAGIAEIIKHALLHSTESWSVISNAAEHYYYELTSIQQSQTFKKYIVSQDTKDTGARQQLNLGHSIGHALESLYMTKTNALTHGEAVMVGLHLELLLSEELLQFPSLYVVQFISLKDRLFPHLSSLNFTFEEIRPLLLQDKKNTNCIRMSLLQDIGKPVWGVDVSEEKIKKVIYANYK